MKIKIFGGLEFTGFAVCKLFNGVRAGAAVFGLMGVALAAPETAAQAEGPLNVVFISVDDLRPELSIYGREQMVTPNFDRLAERGLIFDRAYANEAICMPSRGSVFSGIHPWNNESLLRLGSVEAGLPGIRTLNKHLADNGYTIAATGKLYHHNEDTFGQFGANYHNLRGDFEPGGYVTERGKRIRREKGRGTKGLSWESGDAPDDAYPDGARAAWAVEKLEEFAADPSEKPFFLGVGFIKPHLPFVAPQKYFGLYPPESVGLSPIPEAGEGIVRYNRYGAGEITGYVDIPDRLGPGHPPLSSEKARELRRGYYACVSFIDAQLGRILDALDETGLSENTVVVLWGDHGWMLGDQGTWCKKTVLRFALEVPLIIAAPGGVKGERTDALAELADLYPTLSELLGLPLPEHLEGRSLAPVLRDPSVSVRDHVYAVWPAGPKNPDRTVIGQTVLDGRYRYTEWRHQKSGRLVDRELFDWRKDPLESRSLLLDEPDPALVERLEGLLREEWPVEGSGK